MKITKHLQMALLLSACSLMPTMAQAAPEPAKIVKPALTNAVKSKAPSLNLNSANAAELTEKLVGVGPKKAEAIVAWRKANGGFKNPAQLMEVKGIGPSLYEKNKAILSTR